MSEHSADAVPRYHPQAMLRPCLCLTILIAACNEPPAPTPATATTSATTTVAATASASHAASTAIVKGAPAPDVTLKLHDGKELKLSSLKGEVVLLYFYPKDDTPGCTVEAQVLRDNHETLTQLGVKVFGVSLQDAASHQAFIDKHDLPFPLVVDEGGEVARAFEVPVKGEYAARHSFLIGRDGRIAEVWREVTPAEHADQVIAATKSLGS